MAEMIGHACLWLLGGWYVVGAVMNRFRPVEPPNPDDWDE